ncbi:GNAT family N-acetyltransferase [Halobacillus sp. A5]|uniref:GNAT family N-acetyltransferase n=1 Tax=Halobacillus sp. A5 TaxID=2880263 RepID=UPI0021122BB8|nr:GNAT family N-acetyltransferase [Halobacillus sp. A5]MCP3028693.1 GNAT family N-acetyltransferase [Halobacillus sp. A5]
MSEITRLCMHFGYEVTEEQINLRLNKLLDNNNNGVFVYESGEEKGYLGGWVHIYGKQFIELDYAEIGGLVVDSRFRRQGIGPKLMKKSEEWAKDNGFQEIRLRSGGQRNDTHKFYERMGYKNINWQQLYKLRL